MSLLSVKKISLTRESRKILKNVSFSVDPGEVLGLIGPNGSGKSSLLKSIAGIYPDFLGEIDAFGSSVRSISSQERAKKITYVGAETDSEFPLTAMEVVVMGTYCLGIHRLGETDYECVKEIMVETGCWEYRDQLLSRLSGGERQRVAIARAFLQGSKVICLDESFSKLDLHHQARMGELLKKYTARGFSFILVSHDLNYTTDWADRCVLLKAGEIVADGTTKSVISEENLKKLYPDAQIVLSPHPITKAMKVYFKR